jgi:hypothetical protein
VNGVSEKLEMILGRGPNNDERVWPKTAIKHVLRIRRFDSLPPVSLFQKLESFPVDIVYENFLDLLQIKQ